MNCGNEKAVGEVCRPAQQLGEGQGIYPYPIRDSTIIVSENQITLPTNQKTAETATLKLLRQAGYEYIQELDWIAKRQGKFTCFEVKSKSRLFHPPPFWGLGLDLAQAFLREQIRKELSLRTFLIAYCGDCIYGQFLDQLESGKKYLTPNEILIFPLESFVSGHDAILEVLRGYAND